MRGKIPFNNQDKKKFLISIRDDDVVFDKPWKEISTECKDFLIKLLSKLPQNRLTAKEALKHPWILNNLPVIDIL